MPTTAEIASAASLLTTAIQADRATLKGWQDAAAEAKGYADTATAIEAAGYVWMGTSGDSKVKVSDPDIVTAAASALRGQAAAIRDAVTLPPPPVVEP